jgi:excisionase family DNA binding protein
MRDKNQPSQTPTPIPFDLDRKYTVKEIAKDHLRKSEKTVYNLIRDRKLNAYRFGKEFVITASQLEDYAKDRQLIKHWLVTGAITQVDITILTDEMLSGATIVRSALDELRKHDPEIFRGVSDWLDIQDLPQTHFD